MLIPSRFESAPPVVIDVPPDFHQVPLHADTEDRTAAQLELLDDLGLADAAQREGLSLYLEALAMRLSQGTVTGTAFCAVQVEGHPSTATLAVALHDTHTQDTGLAAMGAAEAMRREGRFTAVEIVELGQQPAVTAVAERAAVAGDAQAADAGGRLRDISVFVPVTGHPYAAMVTVSTPCLEDWDVYRGLALDLGRSVRVESRRADILL